MSDIRWTAEQTALIGSERGYAFAGILTEIAILMYRASECKSRDDWIAMSRVNRTPYHRAAREWWDNVRTHRVLQNTPQNAHWHVRLFVPSVPQWDALEPSARLQYSRLSDALESM